MGNISNNGLSKNFLETAKHYGANGINRRSLERIIESAMEDGKISDEEYSVISQLHDSDFQKKIQNESFDFEAEVSFPNTESEGVELLDGSKVSKSDIEKIASISEKLNLYADTQSMDDDLSLASTIHDIRRLIRSHNGQSGEHLKSAIELLAKNNDSPLIKNLGLLDPELYASNDTVDMMHWLINSFDSRQMINLSSRIQAAAPVIHAEHLLVTPLTPDVEVNINIEAKKEKTLQKQSDALGKEIQKLSAVPEKNRQVRTRLIGLQKQQMLIDNQITGSKMNQTVLLRDSDAKYKKAQKAQADKEFQDRMYERDLSMYVGDKNLADKVVETFGQDSEQAESAMLMRELSDNDAINTLLANGHGTGGVLSQNEVSDLNVDQGMNAAQLLIVASYEPGNGPNKGSQEQLNQLSQALSNAKAGTILSSSDKSHLAKLGIVPNDDGFVNVMTGESYSLNQLQKLSHLVETLKTADKGTHVQMLMSLSEVVRPQLNAINAQIQSKTAELNAKTEQLQNLATELSIKTAQANNKLSNVQTQIDTAETWVNTLKISNPRDMEQSIIDSPDSFLGRSFLEIGMALLHKVFGKRPENVTVKA